MREGEDVEGVEGAGVVEELEAGEDEDGDFCGEEGGGGIGAGAGAGGGGHDRCLETFGTMEC